MCFSICEAYPLGLASRRDRHILQPLTIFTHDGVGYETN